MKLKIKTQDIILYSIAAVVIIVGIWFIYYNKPNSDDAGTTDAPALNTEMPNGKEVRLSAIPEYDEPSVEVASVAEQNEESLSTESDKIDDILSDETSSSTPEMQAGGGAYVSESDWEEIYKIQQENDELRAEKEAAEENAAALRKVQEDQEHKMQMLERSFELASKYSPEGQKAQAEAQALQQERMTQLEKAKAERLSSDSNLNTVTAYRRTDRVVSGLTQTLPDSVLLNDVNLEFNTITDSNGDWKQFKNTIRVSVDEAQTVKIGDKLLLRLKEDIVFSDGTLIPRNTSLIGTTSLNGNRLGITVNSIEYAERIIGVKLQAYDLDGQIGVSVALPGEADALTQFGNALVNSGNSFSFNSNEKERVIGDLSKALIGSGATYLSKKLQTIKIHFKAGFQLYLLDITTKQ